MTPTELTLGILIYLVACILAFFIARTLTSHFKSKIFRWIVILISTILSIPFLIIVFTIVMSANKKHGKY